MHATEREACDVFFSVGASLAIYPAAELPFESTRQGAMVIQVNPQATKLDSHTPYNFHGAAGNVMPAIVRACWPRAD
jgi:NAD-dependent deacetylase